MCYCKNTVPLKEDWPFICMSLWLICSWILITENVGRQSTLKTWSCIIRDGPGSVVQSESRTESAFRNIGLSFFLGLISETSNTFFLIHYHQKEEEDEGDGGGSALQIFSHLSLPILQPPPQTPASTTVCLRVWTFHVAVFYFCVFLWCLICFCWVWPVKHRVSSSNTDAGIYIVQLRLLQSVFSLMIMFFL